MSNDVKFYKNPARNRIETPKVYIPEYQLRGMEPEQHEKAVKLSHSEMFIKSSHSQNNMNQSLEDNPRVRQLSIRQPYAEAVDSPIGRGKGFLPNVGNNIEQTWSGIDGEIVDDVFQTIDKNKPMIDNNDFVETSSAEELASASASATTIKTVENEKLIDVIRDLKEKEYLLVVFGEPICSGPLECIEEEVSHLLFGEHKLYPNNSISINDIDVIKRTPIKIGVFLKKGD